MTMSLAAQNGFLDNTFGPTAGPHSPASFVYVVLTGDPEFGGVVIADAGSVAYAHADFEPADAGAKDAAEKQLPNPAAEWSETAYWWALVNAADLTEIWYSDALDEPLDVTSAGDGPWVQPTIRFSDRATAL